MTDFSQLEARLDAALGVLVATGADSEKDDAKIQELREQIKELRDQLASVQSDKKALEVRIKKAGEQLVSTKARVNRLRDGAAMLNDTIAAKDKEIAALKEAHQEALGQRDKARGYVQQIKEANVALRKANEALVGDPELINSNLEREMEQLQAQHDIDIEEVNTILARLTPLVEGN